MAKKDWKSKAKNPPAGKESPGAMLIHQSEENVQEDKNENVQENVNVSKGQSEFKDQEEKEPKIINPLDHVNDDDLVIVTRKRRRKAKPKPKFEDLHTPHTFHIRNDLLDRFLKMSGDVKGEKTRMINEAIKEYLETFIDEDE